jgi:hypothetical protein
MDRGLRNERAQARPRVPPGAFRESIRSGRAEASREDLFDMRGALPGEDERKGSAPAI